MSTPVQTIITSQNVLCFGLSTGSISVRASGGIGSFTITVRNQNNQEFPNTANNFNNLPAGTYTIRITENKANPEVIESVVTITQPPQLTIANPIISQVTCEGDTNGSARIIASGGTAPIPFYGVMARQGKLLPT